MDPLELRVAQLVHLQPQVAEQRESVRGGLRRRDAKLFARGDTEGALAKYTGAIEADPRSHVSYCNRSACHAAAARWPECAADAHRCIEIEPTFVKGYFRFATALLRLGDADNTNGLHAMVLVEQALQLSPGNADLLELKTQCEQRAAAEQQQQQAAAAATAAVPAGAAQGAAAAAELARDADTDMTS